MEDLNKDFDEVYKLCKIHGLNWEIYKEKYFFEDYVFKVSKMLTRNGDTDKKLRLSKIRYDSSSPSKIYYDLRNLILRGEFLDETEDKISYASVWFEKDDKELYFHPSYFPKHSTLDVFKWMKAWGANYEIDGKTVHITKNNYKKTVISDFETLPLLKLHVAVEKDILDGLLY